jgi:chromosome partitioning protein
LKTLALYNIKGGVGKTSAAVNLAYLASVDGGRTLLWDLDPQGAATYTFRIKPKVKGGGRRILRRKRVIDSLVKGTDFDGLDLLPADFSYRHMDLLLDGRKSPTARIRKVLRPVAKEYDYLFLDCPPGITLLSEAVFEAADVLLVPIIPTTFSRRTLEQLLSFLEKEAVRDVQVLPFFSMVDGRKEMHRRLVELLPRESPGFLSARIPFASDVEKMGVFREPLARYAPRSPSAQAFEALWHEVREIVR